MGTDISCPNILTNMHVLVRLQVYQWITRGFTELLYRLKTYMFYRYNLTHIRIEQTNLKCPSSLRCTPSLSKYLGFCHELWCLQYLIPLSFTLFSYLLSLPNKVWGTYCFCSVSYYYFYYYYSSFFPRSMNLFTADLRNYRTKFHDTWWSYRYIFLVDPKVFRFVVKGVKAIFLGVQRGWE